MGFQITPAHQAIFDAVTAKANHIIIEAVAGSGKTTTIVKALEKTSPTEKILFLAFNKSIATELQNRVPGHVEARTTHSLGMRAYTWWYAQQGLPGRVKVDAKKLDRILYDLEDQMEISEKERKTLGGAAIRLVGLAKNSGIKPGEGASRWLALIDHHNLDMPDVDDGEAKVVELAQTLLVLSVERKAVIDFDDMLYMPFILEAEPPKHDRVFVDEAQDLNSLQHWLVSKALRPNGQMVAVGDRHQAIYGFRGALATSMDRLRDTFDAVELPLHVTYRCPKAVVARAQVYVPHIQHHEKAPEGVCDNKLWAATEADVRGGDMVVCRTTRPAVQLCFSLIRNKIPARVMGRDIGKQLSGLVEKTKAKDINTLVDRIEAWEKREVEKKIKRKASASSIAAIEDRAHTVIILAQEHDTVPDLLNTIQRMFSDTADDSKVTICTIHKAKGLEAERVWILEPHLLPHPMAKRPWEKVQEENCAYVAVTRACSELRYMTLTGGES